MIQLERLKAMTRPTFLMLILSSGLCIGEAQAGESGSMQCPLDFNGKVDRTPSVRPATNLDTTPKFHYQQEFLPSSTKIRSLSDSNGNLILFRTIGGQFKPGFVGTWAQKDRMISTSYRSFDKKV